MVQLLGFHGTRLEFRETEKGNDFSDRIREYLHTISTTILETYYPGHADSTKPVYDITVNYTSMSLDVLGRTSPPKGTGNTGSGDAYPSRQFTISMNEDTVTKPRGAVLFVQFEAYKVLETITHESVHVIQWSIYQDLLEKNIGTAYIEHPIQQEYFSLVDASEVEARKLSLAMLEDIAGWSRKRSTGSCEASLWDDMAGYIRHQKTAYRKQYLEALYRVRLMGYVGAVLFSVDQHKLKAISEDIYKFKEFVYRSDSRKHAKISRDGMGRMLIATTYEGECERIDIVHIDTCMVSTISVRDRKALVFPPRYIECTSSGQDRIVQRLNRWDHIKADPIARSLFAQRSKAELTYIVENIHDIMSTQRRKESEESEEIEDIAYFPYDYLLGKKAGDRLKKLFQNRMQASGGDPDSDAISGNRKKAGSIDDDKEKDKEKDEEKIKETEEQIDHGAMLDKFTYISKRSETPYGAGKMEEKNISLYRFRQEYSAKLIDEYYEDIVQEEDMVTCLDGLREEANILKYPESWPHSQKRSPDTVVIDRYNIAECYDPCPVCSISKRCDLLIRSESIMIHFRKGVREIIFLRDKLFEMILTWRKGSSTCEIYGSRGLANWFRADADFLNYYFHCDLAPNDLEDPEKVKRSIWNCRSLGA